MQNEVRFLREKCSQLENRVTSCQEILNLSPYGIAFYNFNTKQIEFANEKFLDFTGHTKEELYNFNPVSSLFKVNKSLESWNVFQKEFSIYKGNDKLIWLSLKTKVYNEKLMLFLEDISQIRQLETELDKKEIEYQQLINTAPCIIGIMDAQGFFVDVNNTAVEIFGLSREKIIGKSFLDLDLIFEDDLLDSLQYFSEILDGQDISSKAIRLNINNGEVHYFNFYTSLIKKEDEVKTIQIYAQDISDSLLKELKYRILIDNLNDIIFEVDESYSYTFISPQIFPILGYKPKELLGKDVFKLIHPNDLNKIKKEFQRVVKEKEAFNIEYRVQHKDGSYRCIVVSGRLINEKTGSKIICTIKDITKLRKTEERLRRLIESTDDMIFSVDRNGRFITAGGQRLKLYGLEINDVIGLKLEELFGVEEAKKYENIHEKVFRNGKAYTYEHSFSFRGIERTDLTTIYPIRSEDGSIQEVGVICRDITQRKKAENELLESKERYTSIINQSNDGIALLDDQGKIIEWNPAHEKITGVQKNEVLGKFLWDIQYELLPPDSRDPANKEKLQKMIQSNLLKNEADWLNKIIDVRILNKKGEIRFIQQLPFLIKGKTGYMIGSITRDITELKKIESELLREREFLTNVTNMSPIGIATFNLLGDIVYANRQIGLILEVDIDDIIYTNFTQLISKIQCLSLDNKPLPKEELPIIKVLKTEKACLNYRLCILLPSGKRKIISTSVSPIFNQNNKIEFIVAVIKDITQNYHFEEQLKESEARFRNLFENAPISIWEEDFSQAFNYIKQIKASGVNDLRFYLENNPEEIKKIVKMVKIIDVNEISLKLHNASNKEELMAGLDRIFDESSYKVFIEEIIALTKGKSIFEIEFPGRKITGEKVFSLTRVLVVPGFENTLSKVIVSALDIAQIKKAQVDLIESEEKYRRIIEQSLDGIALTDQNGAIVEWNRACEKIFGYKKEEILNTKFWDVISSVEIKEFRANNHLSVLKEQFLKAFEGQPASWVNQRLESAIQLRNGVIKQIEDIPFFINTSKGPLICSIIRDVTEKKQILNELKESEEKFRQLFHNANDGIYLTKIDKSSISDKILEVNDVACQMLGYSRDELISMSLRDLGYKEQEGESNSYVEDLFSKGKSTEETIFRRKNGETFPVEVSSHKFVLKGNTVLLSIIRDISDRKKVERELEDERLFLKNLMELSPVGIVNINNQGKITFANSYVEKIFGLTKDEITQRTYNDPHWIITSIDGGKFPDSELPFQKVMTTKKPVQDVKYTIELKNDKKRVLSINAAPIFNREILQSVVTVVEDITISHKFERELKDSEARFRATFEQAAVGLTHTSLDGRFIRVNNKFCEIVGYSRNELKKLTFQKITHPDDLQEDLEFIQKLLNGKIDTYSLEKRYYHKNGSIFWVNLTVSLHKDSLGNPEYYIAVIENIDRRKTLEFEKNQAMKNLRESEEKFKTLSEQSSLAIVIFQDNLVKYVNSAIFDILEYTVEEILQWEEGYFVKVIYPQDRDFMLDQSRKKQIGIKEGVITNYSIRMMTKSGKIIWVDVHSKTIQFEGKLADFFTFIDITDRRMAFELLEESEKRYRNLFENIPVSIRELNLLEVKKYIDNLKVSGISNIIRYFEENPEEVIKAAKMVEDINMNSASYDLYKVSNLNEFREQRDKIWETRAVEINLNYFEPYLKLLSEKKMFEFPCTAVIGGKSVHLLSKIIIVPGYEDSFSRVLLTEVDISKLKEVEETIRRSEIKFRRLFKDAPVSTWLVDLSVAKNFIDEYLKGKTFDKLNFDRSQYSQLLSMLQIIDVNDASLELYKASSKEELLDGFKNNKADIFIEGMEQAVSAFLQGRTIFEAEGSTRNLVGEKIEIFYRATLVPEFKDDWSFLIVSILDISDLKKTQRLLQESQARYRSILRVAPIGIGLVDDNRTIMYVSKSLADMVGYEEIEMSGKNIRFFYPTEDEYLRVGRIKDSDTDEYGTRYIDSIWQRKDGTMIEVDLRSTPIFPNDRSMGVIFTALDITARKKIEKQLRYERDRAQLYLDIADVILLVIDKHENVTLINRKGYEVLECHEEEILGKNWFENFLPSSRRERAQTTFHEIMMGNLDSIEYDENYVLTKSGEKKLIAWRTKVIKDEKDSVIGTLSSGEDITLSKKTELQLKVSEQRLRSIFDSSPFAMILYELLPDGRLVFIQANQMTDRIFGIDSSKFIGKTIDDVFPGFIETEIPSIYRKVAKNGKKWSIEEFHYKDNKIDGFYEIHAFRSEKNRIVVAFRDITEKVLAKRRLEETEANFQRLFSAMSQGIWVLGKDYLTEFVNPALCNMLGYTEEEILGKSVTDYLDKESVPVLEDARKQRREKRDLPPYELTFIAKDGTRVIAKISGSSLYNEHNEIIAHIGVLTNITAEKHAEEAKRDLERRRADFVSLTSHELRTPLTIIKGYFDIFQQNFDLLSETRKERLFEIVEKNILRLETLITGVSEITRIERGIFSLNTTLVDYRTFLLKSLDPYIALLPNQFTFTIEDIFERSIVNLDAERFSQVINNIMDNAIQHTDKKNRKIEVKCEIVGNQIVKTIFIDNGAGIHEENLELIFYPFISIPTKYSVKGTGIGLYLCKMIVEAHGGTISIESEGKDKGTTLTILLPLYNKLEYPKFTT